MKVINTPSYCGGLYLHGFYAYGPAEIRFAASSWGISEEEILKAFCDTTHRMHNTLNSTACPDDETLFKQRLRQLTTIDQYEATGR